MLPLHGVLLQPCILSVLIWSYLTIFSLLKSIMPISSAQRGDPCINVFSFGCTAQSSNIIQALCHFDQRPYKIKVNGV